MYGQPERDKYPLRRMFLKHDIGCELALIYAPVAALPELVYYSIRKGIVKVAIGDIVLLERMLHQLPAVYVEPDDKIL